VGQDPPGPLLGRGREADVYDLGDGRVLRRYRRGRDATLEAEAMRVVRSAGVSCPTVFDADGSDIVMERIGGVTLATDMARRPWTVAAAGRTLASLHTQLHRVPAPATITRRVSHGDALLHLDLHPENVIVSSTGPVLIDWANVAMGVRPQELQ